MDNISRNGGWDCWVGGKGTEILRGSHKGTELHKVHGENIKERCTADKSIKTRIFLNLFDILLISFFPYSGKILIQPVAGTVTVKSEFNVNGGTTYQTGL